MHQNSDNPCEGCHECGLRCTAGIQMTRPEFERIIAHLKELDSQQLARVLEQDKFVVWFEDIETEQCLFYDVTKHRCLIYPVRPLICRLFGRVEWLPCPIERPLPLLHDGLGIIQAYSKEQRRTFAEWCDAEGIFDLTKLAHD